MIFFKTLLLRAIEIGILYLIYRYILFGLQEPTRFWLSVGFGVGYLIYLVADMMDVRKQWRHERAVKNAL